MENVSRRNFIRIASFGAVAAVLPSWIKASENTKAAKPNFLLIVADDMGFSDLRCYGGEISTPNLDRLAANGLRFTQHYNAGRCWPSRACILTGYYAQEVRRDFLPGIGGGGFGKRPAWAPLLPSALKSCGYRSYHSGKWHVDGKPQEQGFDSSFEYEDTDHHFLSAEETKKAGKPLEAPKSEGYFASVAIADNAIRQLREHASKHAGQPFFEYVAFTEPHFPVQALKEDIDRYRDAYLKGWDQMRQERWKRMKETGIVNCDLSKLDPDVIPAWNLREEKLKERIGPEEVAHAVPWDSLTDEQRRLQATKMAIHAAMVDRVDREIGRILEQLKAMDAYENTVVMFVSDNGASAEMMIRGSGHDKSAPLGSAKSFLCLGPGFATAANTPFRLHKSFVHEGGISTPLIVHWPDGIRAHGELRHDATHLIDIPATLLDLAGGQWPNKENAPARPGISLVPAFQKDHAVHHPSLWWYHENNVAFREGDWKLVRLGQNGAWELYDMRTDRCEMNNLAAEKSEIVKELAEKWKQREKDFIRLLK